MIAVRHRRRALPVALLAVALAAGGCGTSHLDDYNAVEQGNARPADSPAVSRTPAGTLARVGGPVRGIVALGDSAAVQLASPPRLLLGDVHGTAWTARHTIDLPPDAGDASPGADGGVLVPYSDGVVVVDRDGGSHRMGGLGPVTAAAVLPDGRLVTGGPGGDVTVRAADGRVEHDVPGLTAVDQLVVPANGSLAAVSRPDTVFGAVDPNSDEAGPLLRAGKGAGRAAPFSDGAVVVSDTTGNALLVYSTSPPMLRQMFPVAAAPWAVSGDPSRNVVWTTSTGTDTLLAYDLGDGLGVTRAELPTVRQPNSLAVTTGGIVLVGSGSGDALQLIDPRLPAPGAPATTDG